MSKRDRRVPPKFWHDSGGAQADGQQALRATLADTIKQFRALKSYNIKHDDAPADALYRFRAVKISRDLLYSFPPALYLKHQSPCSILCCILELALAGAFCHGCSSPELAVRLPELATASLSFACWSSPPPRCPPATSSLSDRCGKPRRRSLTLLEPIDLASALPTCVRVLLPLTSSLPSSRTEHLDELVRIVQRESCELLASARLLRAHPTRNSRTESARMPWRVNDVDEVNMLDEMPQKNEKYTTSILQ